MEKFRQLKNKVEFRTKFYLSNEPGVDFESAILDPIEGGNDFVTWNKSKNQV